MLAPIELIGRYLAASPGTPFLEGARPAAHHHEKGLAENTLMFCGTLAATGGVQPTEKFEFEIEDPVLGRRIVHVYSVRILPMLG
jgi:hypothetical protein